MAGRVTAGGLIQSGPAGVIDQPSVESGGPGLQSLYENEICYHFESMTSPQTLIFICRLLQKSARGLKRNVEIWK